MSTQLENSKRKARKTSLTEPPEMPTWLKTEPEQASAMSGASDPWLQSEARTHPSPHSDNQAGETPANDGHVSPANTTASPVLKKKPRLASPGASPDGPMDVAPPAEPSESGEDVIIADTTFSDGEPCAGPPDLTASFAAPSDLTAPRGAGQQVAVGGDTVLLTADRPALLYIWGAFEVRVLRGAVSVHGARLTAASARFVPVYALRVKSLPPLVVAAATDEDAAAEEAAAEVTADHLRAEYPSLPDAAVQALRDTQQCVLLVRRLRSHLLTLLAARLGDTFTPRPARADPLQAATGCRLVRDAADMAQLELVPLATSSEWDSALAELMARTDSGGVRWRKGVGKSTWLYYVLNSLLNSRPHVYVLDFDPGQAEFTPCACVSLVRVDQFLIGPSFTHVTQPVRCIFIGEVSIANDPCGYMEAVRDLSATYQQLAAADDAPLLINTMGWAKGLGEDLLLEILGQLQPTDVLEIVHPRQAHINFACALTADHVNGAGRSWLLRQYMSAGSGARPAVTYRHRRLTALGPDGGGPPRHRLAPWMYRQLNTTAFVTSLERTDLALCQLTPICAPWSALALHVTAERLMPQHVLHAINGTVVALCQTDAACWLRPHDQSLFSLLPATCRRPVCHGFGVVRGVDVEQRLLYLLTDVCGPPLSSVNTLMRGPHHVLDVLPRASGLRTWCLTSASNSNPLNRPNQRRKVARCGRRDADD